MKLLLFDLDGTLINTGGAGTRALDRAFRALYGCPCTFDGTPLAGKTDRFIIRQVFENTLGRPAGDLDIDVASDKYLSYLGDEVSRSPGYCVLEGAREILRMLDGRGDVLLALGTGNLERGARIKLEPAGLNCYFRIGGFGSDAEDRRDVLRAAVQRGERFANRQFLPKDVIVIGDTVLDVWAGKALGAVTIAVGRGYDNREALQACKPDVYLESLSEIEAIFQILG